MYSMTPMQTFPSEEDKYSKGARAQEVAAWRLFAESALSFSLWGNASFLEQNEWPENIDFSK